MRLPRSCRFVTAVIAVFSILFMQLAVAAYACPALDVGQGSQAMSAAAATPDMDMADCHDMDPVQPSLCHAYGQIGNQSLDKPAVPPLQPFMAVGFGLSAIPLDLRYPPVALVPKTPFLAHATAPPLAIRHCCFRI